MTDRYLTIVPMNEVNTDADELAFWARRDELFRVYLIDANGQYDSANVATRAEAFSVGREMAAEMGWDAYETTVDE